MPHTLRSRAAAGVDGTANDMGLYGHMGDAQLIDWIKSGGAFGVIALLLWFYRRDWTTLTQYWQQQNTLLMEIVRNNTVELGKMQEAVKMMHAENKTDSEALRTRIHELAQVMSTVAGRIDVASRRSRSTDGAA